MAKSAYCNPRVARKQRPIHDQVISALFGVLMLTVLQACGTANQYSGPNLKKDHEIVSIPSTKGERVARPKPAAPPSEERPRFSKRDLDPKRLLKMSLDGVSSLLGKPQFIRSEAAARVWQYRNESCVLDLFLYNVTTDYEVVYYEFRPAGVLAGPTVGCFENFLIRAADTANS